MMAYTVVIPAFNAAAHIGETLDSVLAQTVPPQQIIVVDDGSSDDTPAVVAAHRGPVTYVRQDNTGPGAATTRGMMMVETEFLGTLDADDLWLPHKAQRQLQVLADRPDVAGVLGRIAEFTRDPVAANYAAAYDGWTRATMMMRTAVAHATAAMVDQPGKMGEVVEWLAIMREDGHRLVMLDEVMTLRRLHSGSLSARSREELSRSYLATARRALERRRAKADGK